MTGALSPNAESFWEQHHRARRDGGIGRVNPLLKEIAGSLRPGAALDLGCGAGGDTIWLARHGWQVTAVDISRSAVERVRTHSRALGITSRVIGERHDLARSFPAGEFDLISAQYFHTPFTLDRARVLRNGRTPCAPAACS